MFSGLIRLIYPFKHEGGLCFLSYYEFTKGGEKLDKIL
jgi:hypothetical protein